MNIDLTIEKWKDKHYNILLEYSKGNVNADISIEIPLKPGTKNIYNITADIPNASLNIFNDNVKLKQAKISGIFNGDQVILNGNGKINSFNSDINFIYNYSGDSMFFIL